MKSLFTSFFLSLSAIGINALYIEKAELRSTLETRAATTCTSGSYCLSRGDGYNGYCCKDQSDCWESCISGKCNGPQKPTTTKTTTTKTPTTSSTPSSASSTTTTTTTTIRKHIIYCLDSIASFHMYSLGLSFLKAY